LQDSVPACNPLFLEVTVELLPTRSVNEKPCSESMPKIVKPEILLSHLPKPYSGGIKETGTILGERQ